MYTMKELVSMSSEGRRTRSRPMEFHRPVIYLTKPGGTKPVGVFKPAATSVIANGRQTTVSESHRYDYKHGHFDGGGPFYTDSVTYGISPRQVHCKEGGNNKELLYTGPCYAPFPTASEITAVGLTEKGLKSTPRSEDTSDLDAFGADAIAQCSPVNPVTTLGTAFAEGTREGLPSLPGIQTWKKRTHIAKAAASEFLNAQFGWLPLVDEISSVRDSIRNQRDILKQYHRDEGRNVRRRFEFPIETSATSYSTTGWATFPDEGNRFSSSNGVAPTGRHLSLVIEKRMWFSGAFTYGLPSQHDTWGRAMGIGSDADKLYGIALTPDVVWELTPWSWAVDWFTNASSVIHNLTLFELAGQIMRYGYMMEETSTKLTVTLDTCALRGSESEKGPSSWIQHVSKVRRPANPFGFGLTDTSLSPVQSLIAAAVGISRS